MPFTRVTSNVPAGIGKVFIHIGTVDGVTPAIGTLDFEVLDGTGKVMGSGNYDIIPHLTAGQLTTINNFLTNLRAKASAEAI